MPSISIFIYKSSHYKQLFILFDLQLLQCNVLHFSHLFLLIFFTSPINLSKILFLRKNQYKPSEQLIKHDYQS